MTYDSITEDGRLWAVRYDDCTDNALYMLFEQWNDVTGGFTSSSRRTWLT